MPAKPLGLIVYDGAATGIVSAEVATVKSVIVEAAGLVTPTAVTVTESPEAMPPTPESVMAKLPAVAVENVPAPVPADATNLQPAVASLTSTPVVVAKLVLGSLRVMVPVLAGTAVVAVKPAVYVAESLATSGETVSVTAVTAKPTETLLVVNAGPTVTTEPVSLLVGVTVTVIVPPVVGLVAKAVIVTTPPDSTGVVRVNWTALGVAEPLPPLTAVTASVAAVPPGGV